MRWYTSFEPGLNLPPQLSEVQGAVLPSASTTTFENLYDPDGHRRQRVFHVATYLTPEEAPEMEPAIVHLGPVANEVDPALARRYPGAFVGVTPQGWLRRWGADGRVGSVPWSEALQPISEGEADPGWDGLVLSEEDLAADPGAEAGFGRLARVAVVTRGRQASLLYEGVTVTEIPPWPAHQMVDPTGAGDVYATLLFLSLARGESPPAAARTAAAAASLAVQGHGLEGVPSREALTARLRLVAGGKPPQASPTPPCPEWGPYPTPPEPGAPAPGHGLATQGGPRR